MEIIFVVLGIAGGGILSAVLLRYVLKNDKLRVLFFDTKKTCEMKSIKPKNGVIKIGKKSWDVTKEKTYMLKNGRNINPFMILTHDSSKAVDVTSKKVKTKTSPDETTALLNLSVLNKLLEPTSSLGNKTALGFSMVMFVFGIATGIALVSMGVVTL